ncbi:hypothetical protein QJQ58_01895 [Paenibacillus dendritiformis]|uniref:hypothetical protein n=1 Tax=Paenibacillus dendritiformis TaxID=130049 RepID=UPI00248C968F|nr:hypothetical protein [Paenibacillus dendritiformis]WGU95055.1 hypothetical protein QJQ58_01895 [Paenibacillus dendritiformis]
MIIAMLSAARGCLFLIAVALCILMLAILAGGALFLSLFFVLPILFLAIWKASRSRR